MRGMYRLVPDEPATTSTFLGLSSGPAHPWRTRCCPGIEKTHKFLTVTAATGISIMMWCQRSFSQRRRLRVNIQRRVLTEHEIDQVDSGHSGWELFPRKAHGQMTSSAERAMGSQISSLWRALLTDLSPLRDPHGHILLHFMRHYWR